MNLSRIQPFLSLIIKKKRLLFTALLFASISILLGLLIPSLFGTAIDSIVGPNQVDFQSLKNQFTLILICLILVGLSTWIQSVFNYKLCYQMIEDLRNRLNHKLHHLDLRTLEGHSIGDLESRIINDTEQIGDGLLLGFSQFYSGILSIVFTIYFMIQKSFWISLLVIVLSPLSFAIAKYISTKSYTLFKRQSQEKGELGSLVEEMIGEKKTIDSLYYQEEAQRRFNLINTKLSHSSQAASFYSSLTNPSTRFVNGVIYALVAYSGFLLIQKGELTIGAVSTLLAYSHQYMKPFNEISAVLSELQNALACRDRVFEILETQDEKDGTQSMGQTKGEVLVENVQFSYEENQPFIQNFSVHAKPGQTIAIVGPTGCGKTTFINLLMRFYEVEQGHIFIDGKDIQQLSKQELRKNFGMVLQESWIQHASLRDNLLLANLEASDQDILEVAKKVQSYDFIQHQPNQLDTILTEDSLSHGEKQLLCITRVMLAKPPILILDEATSSIDTRTERLIQKAFDELTKGKTAFIVAHRLSTIQNADTILVMKDGKLIEQGNHQTLIEKKGFYYQLYQSQFSLE